MTIFEEKLKTLYYYNNWDFTTLYGFYINLNHLIEPYNVSYDDIKIRLKDYNGCQLNGESVVLQHKLLDSILKDKKRVIFY